MRTYHNTLSLSECFASWTTNICSDVLDVQETNSRFSQKVPNQKQCLWMQAWVLKVYQNSKYRDCVVALSHSDAEGNLRCPSDYLSHLVHQFSFDATDDFPSNIPESSFPARLFIFESDEAFTRVIMEVSVPI